MRNTFHLAWSLIRIPHLAFSLFIFPLVIGLVLVVVQLIATGVIIQASNFDGGSLPAATKRIEAETNVVRKILYGTGEIRPELQICRWTIDPVTQEEVPPGPSCAPDRLDVALKVPEPMTFNSSNYETIFSGQVDRLHICRSCQPDAVISFDELGIPSSHAYSLFGLAILSLPLANQDVVEKRVEVRRTFAHIAALLGGVYFDIPEIVGGINTSAIRKTLPITLNVAVLIIITLWLALRAHRKVLDYFSHNDVLLPLVAACGKRKFYAAIWVLTGARVFCFLGASIPLLIKGLATVADKQSLLSLTISMTQLLSWLLALVASLSLATMMASVSELKHRHHILSFAYRYIPIVLALFGAVLWISTLLSDAPWMSVIRSLIAGVPIIGMAPLVVGPTINLPILVMLPHAVLSAALFVFALRANARWFAAHLDEV